MRTGRKNMRAIGVAVILAAGILATVVSSQSIPEGMLVSNELDAYPEDDPGKRAAPDN